jgi:aminoglycoside phosphotransferase (APT) family kinase protein
VRDAMRRLGTALGRFHHAHAEPAELDVTAAGARIERYAREIPHTARNMDRLHRWLASAGPVIAGRSTLTLKGIDLRNMLMDDEGAVVLLDPGRMKRTFAEADLSRFLLTYRITHWGSPWFPAVGAPDARAEAEFLAGYAAGGGRPDPRIHRLYLVKEILKHWHTALDVLSRKALGAAASALVRAVYINRFYTRQLDAELRRPL